MRVVPASLSTVRAHRLARAFVLLAAAACALSLTCGASAQFSSAALTTLHSLGRLSTVGTNSDEASLAGPLTQGGDGALSGGTSFGGANGSGTIFQSTQPAAAHPAFFLGEKSLGSGVYYLTFPSSVPFGYYAYLADPNYFYHFDLGYEYVFDAADGKSGVYFYDFKTQGYFYTSPGFPFPYLYDFSLDSVVYYYPDPSNPGHYNHNGMRYFYVFSTGQIISK